MDKFKGTPGPWKVQYGRKKATLSGGIWTRFAKVVTHTKGEFTQLSQSAEGMANARLIAAAPDLLEALESLVFLHACEQEGLSSGQPSPSDWFDAVSKAQAAISKALGEEEGNG